MAVAGIEAGLKTLKIVILNEEKIIVHLVLPIGKDATAVAAERAIKEATSSAGIPRQELKYMVATGTARHQVPQAGEQSPESLCLAKGINHLMQFSGILLDIGSHKALAIKCRDGVVMNIARSDRCAAGVGEYLDIVAELLAVNVTQMGELYRQSREPAEIQSSCTVFAESEIISLLHQKKRPADILKGALKGFAARVYPLLLSAGYPDNVVLVGGIARNTAVVKALEEQIGRSVLVPDNPDIVGALGAALIAMEHVRSAA